MRKRPGGRSEGLSAFKDFWKLPHCLDGKPLHSKFFGCVAERVRDRETSADFVRDPEAFLAGALVISGTLSRISLCRVIR